MTRENSKEKDASSSNGSTHLAIDDGATLVQQTGDGISASFASILGAALLSIVDDLAGLAPHCQQSEQSLSHNSERELFERQHGELRHPQTCQDIYSSIAGALPLSSAGGMAFTGIISTRATNSIRLPPMEPPPPIPGVRISQA
ncbi:hypothetical protein ISCGN_020429 [Ixodes scapularis]